ncbi:glycosyltransferase [bacterium]|nr:glycosyltransferase [bacterium]
MATDPILSIVLPTYREKENLAIFVPQIEREFQDVPIEVIIVDDNSKDGTRELVSQLNNTYGNVVLIERSGLLGIGSALRDGYNAARGEYILSSDADLSFIASDMRTLFNRAKGGVDMVLGYKIPRTIPGGEIRRRMITQEMMLPIGRVCNWIVRIISRVGGHREYNTNFRILRTSTWKKLHTIEDKNFFLFETIFRATRSGARIVEVPVTFHPRKYGESKLNFLQQAPKYFLNLLRLVIFNRTS